MESSYGIVDGSQLLPSFPIETLVKPANQHVKGARFYHSRVFQPDERQIVRRQCKAQFATFPRLQRHLRESLQALQRRGHARKPLAKVDLDDFLPSPVA